VAYIVVRLGESWSADCREEVYDHFMLWAGLPPGGATFVSGIRHDGEKWLGRTMGGGLVLEFTAG
jgi:hypothetical protein